MRCLLLVAAAAVPGHAFTAPPPRMAADVLAPFKAGRALKVISGLDRFDRDLVTKVARAAELGGASCVDIACSPDLVRAARAEAPSTPICVSAVDPELFPACVEAGAAMVEIGNFDAFYDRGLVFTATDVLAMTRRTRELLPDTPLSVTVPHTLHIDDQVALAQELEAAGADIIQTEGKYSLQPQAGGIQGVIERAAPTLAAAYAISRAVRVPVMAASGLSEVTAPLALAAGAAGVGVGSVVNRLNSEVAMIAVVHAIAASMGAVRAAGFQQPVPATAVAAAAAQ